jgi:hypothetical protein
MSLFGPVAAVRQRQLPSDPPSRRQAYAYGHAYASLLVLEARLEDPKLGTLWTGEVRLSNGSGNPEYGDAAADRAALTLLTQLRDAQLIDISWRPPTAPRPCVRRLRRRTARRHLCCEQLTCSGRRL